MEQELQRPIWVYPSVPSDMTRAANLHLASARLDLSDPGLTYEELEELAIIVAMTYSHHPTVDPYPIVMLDGEGALALRSPRDIQPFPLVFTREADDIFVGFVEKARVFCTIQDLPYCRLEGDEVKRIWEMLVEATRLAADETLVERLEEARLVQIREQVSQLVLRNNNNAIRSRRLQIAEQEGNIRRYEEQLREALIAVRTNSEELELLTKMRGEDTGEKLLHEYDLLKEHPRITKIDFQGDSTLILKTDLVVMTHPRTGETRNLGRFKITLNLANNGISAKNLDNTRHGRDHPHISSGEPCFGGHARQFTEVLVGGRWSVFLELMFQFLETFNLEDDWGAYASYWYDEPDWDPTEAPEGRLPGTERPIVATSPGGLNIRVGDHISFSPGSFTADRYSGTVVQYDELEQELSWAVMRDDGHVGAGNNGEWLMDGIDLDSILVDTAVAV